MGNKVNLLLGIKKILQVLMEFFGLARTIIPFDRFVHYFTSVISDLGLPPGGLDLFH
jgi:hypothetical protein